MMAKTLVYILKQMNRILILDFGQLCDASVFFRSFHEPECQFFMALKIENLLPNVFDIDWIFI